MFVGDWIVTALKPDEARARFGAAHADAMASLVFTAALALQQAGWKMNYLATEAKEIARLRWVEEVYKRYGQPIETYETRGFGPATLTDETNKPIVVPQQQFGDAVLDLGTANFGPATFEDKR